MSLLNNHKFIAFETIVIKEVRRFSRIWLQTLVPPAITIGLYFVIFGNLVGRRIGEIGGFQYMEFIVPGLIMMAVIQNSYSNVVSSFFSQKFQRSVEELLVSPVPNYVILSGFIVGGMARGLAVGAIVTSLALFFADIQIAYPLITISVILLTSIVFSLAGFINAVFANSFDDISIIPTFVLTPLIYLGGVFYSAQLLPPFWQTVTLFNPVVYLVSGFRWSFFEVADVNVLTSLAMILVFLVACLLIVGWMFKTGYRLRQ